MAFDGIGVGRGYKGIGESPKPGRYWCGPAGTYPHHVPIATIATVTSGNECPSCNENREDWLIWRDDWVVCGTCGYVHNPGKEQLMDEMDQSGVYPV